MDNVYILFDNVDRRLDTLGDGLADLAPVGPLAGGIVVLERIVETVGVFVETLGVLQVRPGSVRGKELGDTAFIIPGVVEVKAGLVKTLTGIESVSGYRTGPSGTERILYYGPVDLVAGRIGNRRGAGEMVLVEFMGLYPKIKTLYLIFSFSDH